MSNNLRKKEEICPSFMHISNISTGFIEVPTQISLNIYVQGCKLRCNGCQNQDLQPFDGGTVINLEDLPKIMKHRDLPTWICWLGGDAVYQPDGFLSFNRFFRKNNYKVCLYTGKLFSEVKNLLEDVDLVIDGPWGGETVDKEGSNQSVYLKQNKNFVKYTFNELKTILMEV